MTEPSPPNLNGLVELSHRGGVDIRPTLLRVMTDLYVQKPQHTEQEAAHFTELTLRLIDLVDAKTRTMVAEKIAGYPNAPAPIRHRLLKDLIAIKAPQQAAPEGTPRPAGSAPADELSELFFSADAEERRLILLNLPYAPLPPATTVAAAESLDRMEAAALGHNTELFARELERTLSVSRVLARRMIEDESGEPTVVAALALRMPSPVLQRVLLCLSPVISQSVQRVYELVMLHEEIEADAALRMVAIWQASHPVARAPARMRQGTHQPLLFEGGRERAAPAAQSARPKMPWEQLAQSRRDSA